MNLTLAHTMLRKHGYCLELRDVKKRHRTFCLVIANNGRQEHILCHMSKFALIGTNTFSQIVETRISR